MPPSMDSPLRSNPPDKNFAATKTVAGAGLGGKTGMAGGRSASGKTVPSVRKKGAQPREAVAERTTNDELISFLNQGPPQVGAKVAGNNQHAQLSQQSAPNSAGHTASSNSRTFDRQSSANRSSSQTSQSVAESTNSRSGLLTKRNTAGTSATTASGSNKTDSHYSSKATTPVSATKPSATSGAADFGGQGQGPPQRKQRRVKDPYAISDDDEDDEHDDELGDLPSRDDTHGESLIDFLRNSEPPASASNDPAITNPASQQLPKGVTSSSAVGGPVGTSRLSRGTSPQQSTSNSKDGGSGRPSRTTSLRRNNNNSNTNGSGGTATPTGGGVSSPSDALPDFLRESRNPAANRDDAGPASRQRTSDDTNRAVNNRSASPRKAAGGGKGVGSGKCGWQGADEEVVR